MRGARLLNHAKERRRRQVCAKVESARKHGYAHKARGDRRRQLHIAIAIGLLGLAVDGIVVADPEVVSKSWPGYWDMLGALPAHLR